MKKKTGNGIERGRKESEMLKDNAAFIKLDAEVTAFAEEKSRDEKRKAEIIAESGWEDSPELDAWYEERIEKNKKRKPSGVLKALFCWRDSVAEGRNFLVMKESLWESEIKDFADAAKTAGVGEIVITDESTGLMVNLHGFAANGYVPEALVELDEEDFMGRPRKAKGIRLVLSEG